MATSTDEPRNPRLSLQLSASKGIGSQFGGRALGPPGPGAEARDEPLPARDALLRRIEGGRVGDRDVGRSKEVWARGRARWQGPLAGVPRPAFPGARARLSCSAPMQAGVDGVGSGRTRPAAASDAGSPRSTGPRPRAAAPPAWARATRLPTWLQWNILADGLAQSGDFKYAAKEHLEWKHRFALMLAEIEEGQPDIITLQVRMLLSRGLGAPGPVFRALAREPNCRAPPPQECNHFKDSWEPKLGAMGYKGLHVAKHSSPATVYGAPSDGLAVFWRDARLECRDHFNFQYRRGRGPQPRGAVSARLLSPPGDSPVPRSKYLDVPSNQSALLAHFTFRLPKEAMNGASSGVLLATTHLKAKVTPENDRIRHGQALGEGRGATACHPLRPPPARAQTPRPPPPVPQSCSRRSRTTATRLRSARGSGRRRCPS